MSQLRVLPPLEPAPLPNGELVVTDVRRPGELYEVVSLEPKAASEYAARANVGAIAFDTAVAILVELRLLEEDLYHAGVPLPAPPLPQPPERRLSAADATYLRALLFGRRRQQPIALPLRAALPVRVVRRASARSLTAAAAGRVEDAIAWEAAAVAEGRTIAETGSLRALRGCDVV